MEGGKVENLVIKEIEKYEYSGFDDLQEPYAENLYDSLQNGRVIEKNDVEMLIRFLLREMMWCKLENDGFFVHFGYDYYMYIGSEKDLEEALEQGGLFVEEMKSLYCK